MMQIYKEKKRPLKCYQMVLYTIKNLLPTKDILKILPSSGINVTLKFEAFQKKSIDGTQQKWNKIKQY